jgi:gamma-glutamyltranspeptidase/glutathione hydrolase
MQITTGRPATLAPKGMVTSPHALASQAGVDVLRAGGSAVDAALATSAVLAVVYPHMTGIGGDAFWLIHDADRGAVRYLDGGGRAAASASIEGFMRRGLSEIPYQGIEPATLTTPGALASWGEAHAAHGRLPLARCLEAAIGYARDGYPVTERLAGWIAETADLLRQDAGAAALFRPDGAVPRAGSLLRNPDLARTLEAIATHGCAEFYTGGVGAALARHSAEHGGHYDAADLAAQTARWGEPLQGRYRDVTLYETPAPTQGFTVLEMLNLIEPYALHTHAQPHLGADAVHLMVQAKQVAYHDRDRHLGDPRFMAVPTDRLISKAHADARRPVIDPARALPWDRVPSEGSLTGDTVFIAVVDAQGQAVGLIQSLYGAFGSGVVAGDTGVLLQNRSAYFSLDPAHPNALAPGKTPLHTLIASMAMRDGRLWAVVGCMGADGQPQIHLQTYVAMIDAGLDIQQALEAPRWLSGRFALGDERDTLHIEARMPAATIDELERRGHHVDRWGDWNELAGHAHGIVIDPQSGVRIGGSDPRSDGAAIGY